MNWMLTTGNRVQILVEMFCICFLQIYVGVVHIPLPLLRSNCRGRQGLYLYVGYDNICDHYADWGPHCTTKYLLVMPPLISVVAFSLYQFQQVYNLCFSESSCLFFLIFIFTMLIPNFTGRKVKNGTTSKDKSSSAIQWLSTFLIFQVGQMLIAYVIFYSNCMFYSSHNYSQNKPIMQCI